VQNGLAFYSGLGLLICGNGFFKPNISNIVGTLYRRDPGRRDGGFTIFYMGVNLGAAMSPLLCGYIGETYGWSYGFACHIGMLTGLVVFVLPGGRHGSRSSGRGVGGRRAAVVHPASDVDGGQRVRRSVVGGGGGDRRRSHSRAACPSRPAPRPTRSDCGGGCGAQFRSNGSSTWARWCRSAVRAAGLRRRAAARRPAAAGLCRGNHDQTDGGKRKRLAAIRLGSVGAGEHAGGHCLRPSTFLAFDICWSRPFAWTPVARHRMYVVLILMVFCTLFFAFFEQAGSSLNNFTDRNVDRIPARATIRTVAEAERRSNISLEPTQEQVGFHNGPRLFTRMFERLRREHDNRPISRFPAGGRRQRGNAGSLGSDEIPPAC